MSCIIKPSYLVIFNVSIIGIFIIIIIITNATAISRWFGWTVRPILKAENDITQLLKY